MLNHINHKMTIYKDCTLVEVMSIAIGMLLFLTLLFAILFKVLLGLFWPGYLLGSALFFPITKLLISQLQKLKYGKPHAYYKHLLIKKLAEKNLINSKYETRAGRWSVWRNYP